MEVIRLNDNTKDTQTDYCNKLGNCIAQLRRQDKTISKIVNILRDANTIFVCGNGGSAAIASHFVTDLQKIGNLKAIALTDNVPLITAWANDMDYKYVFASQLYCLAKKGDVLIVFSGSGCSRNIIEVCHVATEFEITTIAVVGTDGGVLKKHANNLTINELIHFDADMYHSEDMFSVTAHLITMLLEKD